MRVHDDRPPVLAATAGIFIGFLVHVAYGFYELVQRLRGGRRG